MPRGKAFSTAMQKATCEDEDTKVSSPSEIVEIVDNDGSNGRTSKGENPGSPSSVNTPRVSFYSWLRRLTAV